MSEKCGANLNLMESVILLDGIAKTEVGSRHYRVNVCPGAELDERLLLGKCFAKASWRTRCGNSATRGFD